jgi:transposase
MEQINLQGATGRPLCRPKRLAGDKGYSYPGVRQWLRDRGIEAVIPYRSDQLAQYKGSPPFFDRAAYRKRNAIERCIGWLKECRRFAMRYEKLAENFLAMLDLAFIQRYLKIGFSDTA